MALINCPECGKEISDKAESCPHCGCPVITEERASAHSPLSIIAALLCFATITGFLGLIFALVDLGAYRNDGRKHMGSYLGLAWLAIVIIMLIFLPKLFR